MSASLLCQKQRKALATVHDLSGNDYVSRVCKRVMWKLVFQNDELGHS